MSRKNSSYSRKHPRKGSYHQNAHQNSSHSSDEEYHQQDYRRIRVIQKNLVYAIGLTDSIATPQILQGPLYFGQFGKVLKIVINRNSSSSKTQRYTCYVTYSNEVDASLAVLTLDDFQIGERPLKVSYGTTKYCSYFLKKNDCPNIKDCYFLHKWDYDNEITVDDNSKVVFNKLVKIAMQVVTGSFDQIITRYAGTQLNNSSLFPSISQGIHRLYEQNCITKQQYEQFVNKPQAPQLSKSESTSTLSSPIKLLQQIPVKVDNLIEKLLLKSISKEAKSKLGFLNNDPQSSDRIKKYFDQYLR